MKKYLVIFNQGIMSAIQYRAEIILWILIDFVPFLVMIFIWTAIYSGTSSINNYTLSQVIQYYLIIAILQRVTDFHFESSRAQQVRDGKIDFRLTKPFSYLFEIYSDSLGGKVLTFLLFIPALIGAFFVAKHFIPTFTLSFSLNQAPQLILLLASSQIIQFLFSLWIVLLTFWLEGSTGLEHFKWIVVALFSGTIMPVEFLPTAFQTVINILPFKYLYAVPIAVMQNKYTMQANDYIYLGITLTLMLLFTKFFWKRARFRYSSVGG